MFSSRRTTFSSLTIAEVYLLPSTWRVLKWVIPLFYAMFTKYWLHCIKIVCIKILSIDAEKQGRTQRYNYYWPKFSFIPNCLNFNHSSQLWVQIVYYELICTVNELFRNERGFQTSLKGLDIAVILITLEKVNSHLRRRTLNSNRSLSPSSVFVPASSSIGVCYMPLFIIRSHSDFKRDVSKK